MKNHIKEKTPDNRTYRDDYVWFVTYGVDMLEERFNCYIQGGKFRDKSREYPGCTDKSLPLAKMLYILPYEFYYANHSSTWDDSAVAFLDTNTKGKTYGVAYLIRKDQLDDLCRQENGGKLPSETKTWYDCVFDLGEWDRIRVVTLTSATKRERNAVGGEYFFALEEALMSNYSYIDEGEFYEYLKRR